MASQPQSPHIFDAGAAPLDWRHQSHAGTGSACMDRGEETMQAPFVSALSLF